MPTCEAVLKNGDICNAPTEEHAKPCIECGKWLCIKHRTSGWWCGRATLGIYFTGRGEGCYLNKGIIVKGTQLSFKFDK